MNVAEKVSEYNWRRKMDLFIDQVRPRPGISILDVGVLGGEGRSAENFLEKHYPYPQDITALGIDDLSEVARRYPGIKVVQYDGGIFPFRDKSFDVCWSNAVLEHVGGRQDQVQFLKEIHRVSRLAFVTTPNRYFPIEVHTLFPFV